MSVTEIKEELKTLQDTELDEVAAQILQLRRSRNPDRKKDLADLLDSPDWVEWKKPEEK